MATETKAASRQRTERGPTSALRRVLGGWRGVRVQTKFGNASFQTGERVFAFTRRDGVVLKLPEGRIRVLVEERGTEFLVMGKRTMREWMVLRLADREGVTAEDLELVREAMEYVARRQSSCTG